MTKRKLKSSELEVFEDCEEVCLDSPLPEKPLSLFKCGGVEKPLDLSQMDSFKQTRIKSTSTKSISQKMAVSSSFAAPPPICLPRAAPVHFTSLCPPTLPPQNSLSDSLASPKQLGPSPNDQGLETRTCTDVSFESRPLPRLSSQNLTFGSLAGSAFSGALFSSKQFDLPKTDPRHQIRRRASISLELDPPLQQSPFSSSPILIFHDLSDSSPIHLQNTPAPLSASSKLPRGLFDLAHNELGASPPNVSARAAPSDSLQRESWPTSSHESSFETESDETSGVLASRFLKKMAKSKINRSDFPAVFLAQENKAKIFSRRSQRSFVPWNELFSLQTEVCVLFLKSMAT